MKQLIEYLLLIISKGRLMNAVNILIHQKCGRDKVNECEVKSGVLIKNFIWLIILNW
jgi:hypothetical protein